ncbi:TolC family protein [Sulfuricurvum sp.]|uniref:TolC family protein n=1 Tax=Sulfuricurvum sp. TaxID=2025608 RepID=UPI00260DEE3D|nr:TolC family protein [Sulfuricurvum sp.]MDD2780488.1 TolC family protein [Sulfuricurvum sp.]
MKSNPLLSVITLAVFALLSNAQEPLTLGTAYELALKHEPKLQSLYLKTAANGESIEQVRSRLFPQIQGTVSVGRYEYAYQASSKATKENYTDYSISAVQPIFRPEYWRGLDQAKSKYESALEQLKAQQQQVGLDVSKAYFSVLHSEKSAELASAQKLYYEQKYVQLEEMLKIGLTNKIDFLETKIARDKARSLYAIEQKRAGIAKLRLQNMIGKPIEALHELNFEMIDVSHWIINKSELNQKLDENPLYKSAKYTVKAAEDEVAIRNYEHYPKVDLSLTRKETNSADPITHIYDNQAIVRMSIPIYAGGYVQSRVREGILLLDAAQQEREYYSQETNAKFEEAWEESHYSVENYNNLKDSERSAHLYVESVEKAHAAGLKSIIDLLEARAKLFEIKRDLINAGYEVLNNRLLLLDITGELNAQSIALLEKDLNQ